jgi:hypothetical protein
MRENIAMHFVQAKGILSQNNGMNIYRGRDRNISARTVIGEIYNFLRKM